MILGGLAYKMVIASLIHKGYSLVAWGDGPVWQELWTQVIVCYRYGLYLFFDFAGYTMMAMGAGYCLGVRVPRNFRAPFLAQDLIDFWNRWHITPPRRGHPRTTPTETPGRGRTWPRSPTCWT